MKTWNDLIGDARSMGVTVEEVALNGNQCGEYNPITRTAIIDPTMSPEQRVCTLQHELIHARHFDMGFKLMDRDKEEALTRKETALALINYLEYARAEHVYEGEPYAMAEALGVTYGVLCDYRRWLHDSVAIMS